MCCVDKKRSGHIPAPFVRKSSAKVFEFLKPVTSVNDFLMMRPFRYLQSRSKHMLFGPINALIKTVILTGDLMTDTRRENIQLTAAQRPHISANILHRQYATIRTEC